MEGETDVPNRIPLAGGLHAEKPAMRGELCHVYEPHANSSTGRYHCGRLSSSAVDRLAIVECEICQKPINDADPGANDEHGIIAHAVCHARAVAPDAVAQPIEIDYINYRGERGVRLILPTGRMLPGDPEYHPGVPWVIEAVDCAKAALRTFDPAKIHRWTPQPAGSPIFAPAPSARADGAPGEGVSP